MRTVTALGLACLLFVPVVASALPHVLKKWTTDIGNHGHLEARLDVYPNGKAHIVVEIGGEETRVKMPLSEVAVQINRTLTETPALGIEKKNIFEIVLPLQQTDIRLHPADLNVAKSYARKCRRQKHCWTAKSFIEDELVKAHAFAEVDGVLEKNGVGVTNISVDEPALSVDGDVVRPFGVVHMSIAPKPAQ
jgi:hypothetical protein